MASNSLVGSANLITKVYFPRLTIPLATVLAGLVDFALAFPVLFGLMWWYGVAPTVQVIWLPLFIALAFVTALGVGLWLSALNVEFRDVRHVVPFLTQLWMFATPIAYPSSLLPEKWRTLYALNPMVGVVEGFRWALLGTATRPGPMILVSAFAAIAPADRRRVLLPPHGAHVRRCRLTALRAIHAVAHLTQAVSRSASRAR